MRDEFKKKTCRPFTKYIYIYRERESDLKNAWEKCDQGPKFNDSNYNNLKPYIQNHRICITHTWMAAAKTHQLPKQKLPWK